MKANEFTQNAEHFIRAVAHQRIYLVKTHKSGIPDTDALDEATALLRNLDAYQNRTNQQMARFWNKNFHRILYIMPGKGSGSYSSMIETYKYLTGQSKDIMLQSMIKPDAQKIIVF